MTPDVHQLSHRIARDYLIDQLVPASIGLPRPQLDLPFEVELPKVAYGQKAHFFLSFSQKGVRYRLKAAGQWLGDWQAGTGATIAFYSDPMAEDLQFEMWAEKALPDQQLFRLYTLVFVQVGIDNTLPVSLDPALIPYMETTSIRVERTQEGVMYEAYALDSQGN